MRTGGASDALGFAQVMQAFETEQQSLSADQADRDQADVQSSNKDQPVEGDEESAQTSRDEKPSDQSSQSDQQQSQTDRAEQTGNIDQATNSNAEQVQPTPSDASSSTVANDANNQVDHPQANTPQPQQTQSSQIQTTGQVNVGDESAFRLLENQSDQARLTIKGVVRSMTHAADANLTAIAVNTRLGQNQPIQEPTSQVPVQTQPAQPTAEAQSSQVSAQIQSPQLQSPDLPAGTPQVILANTLPIQHAQAYSRSDVQQTVPAQATPESGQIHSQRVDVASVVSQAVSSTQPLEASAISLSARNLAGINRTQNQQVIRTVTSIDSGSVGNQPTSTDSGSQVGRMQPTEMLSETRRASVMAQVQRGLASLLRSGDNEMTLKLTPGHLGEIRIQIKTQGDQLAIRFETSSQEATQYLNASIKDLTANLLAKGMNLQSVEINHEAPQESANTNEQNSTNPDARSSDRDHQQSNEHSSHQRANEAFDDDLQSDEPESVWTELGLDAIA
ncbi:hypothetical protein COB72_05165 [bacterium]|nr:MAG: hypothetical protein COB72_05165 [bacterium]